MLKWAEVLINESHGERDRFDFLSSYLNNLGFKNEVQHVLTSSYEFKDRLLELKSQVDQIRIHSDLGILVVQEFESMPSEIVDLGAADAFVYEKGGWWFRNFLQKAFLKTISKYGSSIDLESSALIVGTGARARVFASGFIKVGFSEVNISSIFDEQGTKFVDALKRKYFGVNINFVPQSRLVTLPGIHGVLVNSTPIDSNNELINELNYFNFLQKEGLVIDLNLFPVESRLTKEAKTVGAVVIQGYQILALADILWAQSVFGIKLDAEKYVNEFYNKFKLKAENSESALS